MKKRIVLGFVVFLFTLMLVFPMNSEKVAVQGAQTCPLCGNPMENYCIINTYSESIPGVEIHFDTYWYCYKCHLRDEYPYCTWDGHAIYQSGFSYQTCTTDGYYTATCSICGVSESHITGYATGHDWSDWVELQPAKCFQNGEYQRKCNNCPETEHKVTPFLDHKPGQWHLEYCASETGPGRKVRNCEGCGMVMDIEYVDHEWKAWTTTDKPTCTTPGKEVTECMWCSATQSRLIEAYGHDLTGWYVDWYCGDGWLGQRHKECTRCKQVIEKEYFDHTPGDSWFHAYYPADGENGLDYKACIYCGTACETSEYPLELTDLNEIPQVLMPLAQELSPHDNLVQLKPIVQEDGAAGLDLLYFQPETGMIYCEIMDGAEDYRIDLYKEEPEGQFTRVSSLTSQVNTFILKEELEKFGDGAYSAVVWARKDGHRISAMVPCAFVYLQKVPAVQECTVEQNYLLWTPGRHLPDNVVYEVTLKADGQLVDTVRTTDSWLDLEPYGCTRVTASIVAKTPDFLDSDVYTTEELTVSLPAYYVLEEDGAVYEKPDSQSAKQGELKSGMKIRVWEQKDDFYRIDYDGFESWIQCSKVTSSDSLAGLKVTIDLGEGDGSLVLRTNYQGKVSGFILPEKVQMKHPGEKIVGFSSKKGGLLKDSIPAVQEDTTFYASWGKDPDQVLVHLVQPAGVESDDLYFQKGSALYGLPTVFNDSEMTWFTEKDGEGTEYRNGFLLPEDQDEITLYGVCYAEEEKLTELRKEKGFFTVTFDPGIGACEVQKVNTYDPYRPDYYGAVSLHTIPLGYAGALGYSFVGWQCDSERFVEVNGTNLILPGQEVVILQNETFTAVYQKAE